MSGIAAGKENATIAPSVWLFYVKACQPEGWGCQDADEDRGDGQADFSAPTTRAWVRHLPLILPTQALVSTSWSSNICINSYLGIESYTSFTSLIS